MQIIALGVLARAEGNISSLGQERDIASLTLFFACFFDFCPFARLLLRFTPAGNTLQKKPVILNISAGA